MVCLVCDRDVIYNNFGVLTSGANCTKIEDDRNRTANVIVHFIVCFD